MIYCWFQVQKITIERQAYKQVCLYCHWFLIVCHLTAKLIWNLSSLVYFFRSDLKETLFIQICASFTNSYGGKNYQWFFSNLILYLLNICSTSSRMQWRPSLPSWPCSSCSGWSAPKFSLKLRNSGNSRNTLQPAG